MSSSCLTCFQRLPLNAHGNLPISEVHLLCCMCAGLVHNLIVFSLKKAMGEAANEKDLASLFYA